MLVDASLRNYASIQSMTMGRAGVMVYIQRIRVHSNPLASKPHQQIDGERLLFLRMTAHRPTPQEELVLRARTRSTEGFAQLPAALPC